MLPVKRRRLAAERFNAVPFSTSITSPLESASRTLMRPLRTTLALGFSWISVFAPRRLATVMPTTSRQSLTRAAFVALARPVSCVRLKAEPSTRVGPPTGFHPSADPLQVPFMCSFCSKASFGFLPRWCGFSSVRNAKLCEPLPPVSRGRERKRSRPDEEHIVLLLIC